MLRGYNGLNILLLFQRSQDFFLNARTWGDPPPYLHFPFLCMTSHLPVADALYPGARVHCHQHCVSLTDRMGADHCPIRCNPQGPATLDVWNYI